MYILAPSWSQTRMPVLSLLYLAAAGARVKLVDFSHLWEKKNWICRSQQIICLSFFPFSFFFSFFNLFWAFYFYLCQLNPSPSPLGLWMARMGSAIPLPSGPRPVPGVQPILWSILFPMLFSGIGWVFSPTNPEVKEIHSINQHCLPCGEEQDNLPQSFKPSYLPNSSNRFLEQAVLAHVDLLTAYDSK